MVENPAIADIMGERAIDGTNGICFDYVGA